VSGGAGVGRWREQNMIIESCPQARQGQIKRWTELKLIRALLKLKNGPRIKPPCMEVKFFLEKYS